ncbi:MAG: Hpt domain-containing protein [Spirochaetales bacterium]|nr:Hpt domain-containing protein [Spirochaetales bacterium]
MNMVFEDFTGQFISETLEMLDDIESVLLDIEQRGARQDGIDLLFRSFHTIKGNAGMVGAESIHDFCHEIENRLDTCRKNHQPITDDMIAYMLRFTDHLKLALEKGNINPDNLPDFAEGNDSRDRNDSVSTESSFELNVEEGRWCIADWLPAFRDFMKVYGLFYMIKTGEDKQKQNELLIDAGLLSIGLTDAIPNYFPRIQDLCFYLEKTFALILRNAIDYEPVSFEVVDRMLHDIRFEFYNVLRKSRDFLHFEIASEDDVADFRYAKTGMRFVVVELSLPYMKLIHEIDGLQFLSKDKRGFDGIIAVYLPPKSIAWKALDIITPHVKDFPVIYKNEIDVLDELVEAG